MMMQTQSLVVMLMMEKQRQQSHSVVMMTKPKKLGKSRSVDEEYEANIAETRARQISFQQSSLGLVLNALDRQLPPKSETKKG
jgi:hypothetical protein